jgi:hypothetical protein
MENFDLILSQAETNTGGKPYPDKPKEQDPLAISFKISSRKKRMLLCLQQTIENIFPVRTYRLPYFTVVKDIYIYLCRYDPDNVTFVISRDGIFLYLESSEDGYPTLHWKLNI